MSLSIQERLKDLRVQRGGRGGFFQHGRILSILKEQPDGAYDPFACGKLSLGISWP